MVSTVIVLGFDTRNIGHFHDFLSHSYHVYVNAEADITDHKRGLVKWAPEENPNPAQCLIITE